MPSVHLSPEVAKSSPSEYKIHILGEDVRSKFIAHALSSVYDSVEMIGYKFGPSSRYSHIQKMSKMQSNKPKRTLAPNRLASWKMADADDSHIDQLIVTGKGYEAVPSIEAVKHRIDENTTVCLMNEGLGVLEDVRQQIFKGSDKTPTFLLGHMTHRLAYNDHFNAVRLVKPGQMKITSMDHAGLSIPEPGPSRLNQNLLDSLRVAKDLKIQSSPLDDWLCFKLPSVIFGCVVEPICVLLDVPYEEILPNPQARRMMLLLLDEIAVVMEHLPELSGSAVVQEYLRGGRLRWLLYKAIRGKGPAPSELVKRIQKGQPSELRHLNGYFLRRAERFGLNMANNRMMAEMVAAKEEQAKRNLQGHIPFIETSLPSDLERQHRTTQAIARQSVSKWEGSVYLRQGRSHW